MAQLRRSWPIRNGNARICFATEVETLLQEQERRLDNRLNTPVDKDSAPGFALLPTPAPTHALVLHPKIELLDIGRLTEAFTSVFHDQAANFHDIPIVAYIEGHFGVLLDQQNGHTLFSIEPPHNLANFTDKARGQPE